MSAFRKSSRTRRAFAAALAALALTAGGLVVASPAAAATLTVTTTADGDANGACTTASVVTPATPTTLRNALCVASNVGGASTVTVPGGTYALTDGALLLGTRPGTDVQLESSDGRATIVGDGTSQLLTLDPALVGGIAVEIDGFAFEGGRDSLYGGGAIIGGSVDGEADSLVVNDTLFSDNTSTGGTANPGGAIQFMGGDLTVTDSVFEGNTSGSASGGAIYYEAFGADDALAVTGSVFDTNTMTAAGVAAGGGAIAFAAGSVGTVQIIGNTFTGNSASGPAAFGGAIEQVAGPATISSNSFAANSATAGSAVHAAGGDLTAQHNSFVGNVGDTALRTEATTSAMATRNWWGCNEGPGGAGCDTAALTAGSTTPHLTLSAEADTASVAVGETATLTGSLLVDSAGDAVPAAALGAFEGAELAWTAIAPAGSSVAPASVPFTDGVAETTFTAGDVAGEGGATAVFGAASVPVAITVSDEVAFTSPTTASAVVGTPFSFSVSTRGFPAPTVTLVDGEIPGGLTMTPQAGGFLISGTPTGPAGSYALQFSADNGGAPVEQTLTIAVGARPTFSGPLAATVAAGEEVDATITAVGSPVPAVTITGTLPAGLTVDANSNGTARLHGVPTVAPGQYSIGVSASNVHGTVTADFTLTITSQPVFTSDDSTTFSVGTEGSFPIEVAPGYPTTGAVVLDPEAPSWLSLTGAAGAQRLVGTPPAGSGGVVYFGLFVDGADGTVTQPFTLTVEEAPVVTTPPASATVLAGAEASFTAAASGFPAPTVQWERFTDGAWTSIPDATSPTLSFTAAIADDGARFRAVFSNSAGSVPTDEAVLTVGEVPVIDQVAPVTLFAGGLLTIDVTTSGLPVADLSAAGVPEWLTFTDAGDGTAVLEGTPALTDAGTIDVTVTAANGFGSADSVIEITVQDEVPLPYDLPAATDGQLTGVPASVIPGQQLTVGGSGFLPGAVVRLGMYSPLTAIGTAVADEDGVFSTTVTIPLDRAPGALTLAASGIGAEGTARLLDADTVVVAPPVDPTDPDTDTGTDTGTGGDSGPLPATGADSSASLGAAVLALLAALSGLALMRGARRRSA
nr:putative Ig domain-containing protein [uncultured Microbacterium sp.]